MDRTQPGAKVDTDVYERFREYVRDRHGAVRGNLGTELEAAMRDRMDGANGPDRLDRIENDVAHVKAMLADAESDGGEVAPTPSRGSDTRTRRTAKPSPNQPRERKIDYLIECLWGGNRPESPESGELAPKSIRSVVLDEYSFDEDIVDEYVETIQKRLVSDFGAKPNPKHRNTLVWGDRLDEVREEVADE